MKRYLPEIRDRVVRRRAGARDEQIRGGSAGIIRLPSDGTYVVAVEVAFLGTESNSTGAYGVPSPPARLNRARARSADPDGALTRVTPAAAATLYKVRVRIPETRGEASP